MEDVIDTNVLVYDMLEDSALNKEAQKSLDKLSRWVIPSVVIEEFVIVLRKLRIGDDIIFRKKELMGAALTEIAPIRKQEVTDALSFLSSENVSSRRFCDKLIVSVAKQRKLHLLTFDEELKRECKKSKINTWVQMS